MDKGFYHKIHGNKVHDTMRMLGERFVIENDGKIKDGRVFKDRACPCEPDLYYEIETKGINGNKRKKMKEIYVVEFETSPSTESIKKKYEQYKETLVGLTDLIVVDMDKGYKKFLIEYHKERMEKTFIYDDLFLLEEYIKWRMPV